MHHAHSSSDRKSAGASRIVAACLISAVFAGPVAGCSTTTSALMGVGARGQTETTTAPTTTALTTTGGTTAAASEHVAVSTSDNAPLPGVAHQADGTHSSWCDYLVNNANAQAEIIASPSVSASTDDSGNYSVNIGVNLLDYRRAELVRQSGEVKCNQHTASRVISSAMQLADEAALLASAVAKEAYLRGKAGEMEKINSKARNLASSGDITSQQADAVFRLVAARKAEMENARSDIEKRKDFPSVEGWQIAGRNRELVEAETRLQGIDREIRTLDALSIDIEGGYRAIQADALLGDPASEDVYAKVKLGLKLGALSPRRRAYEDAAMAARQNSLNEELGGPIWRATYAESSGAKALPGLKRARDQISAARNSAEKTAANLAASDRPELVANGLAVRLEAIGHGAELAGANAAIMQIEQNLRRLGTLRQ
ncbi:MAG: hypothetical protein R3D32_02895 [Nitratireductor sp.]